ncbi:L-serine ammonia-lyase, partial [Vibrio parahaemolyticus]|nr:L-serine ammonia-lyase [Vibrio parahaemolyticus]
MHENGMSFTALDAAGAQVSFETYYSNVGGFISTAPELEHRGQPASAEVPFPITSADEMLEKA